MNSIIDSVIERVSDIVPRSGPPPRVIPPGVDLRTQFPPFDYTKFPGYKSKKSKGRKKSAVKGDARIKPVSSIPDMSAEHWQEILKRAKKYVPVKRDETGYTFKDLLKEAMDRINSVLDREGAEVERHMSIVSVAGNSREFLDWLGDLVRSGKDADIRRIKDAYFPPSKGKQFDKTAAEGDDGGPRFFPRDIRFLLHKFIRAEGGNDSSKEGRIEAMNQTYKELAKLEASAPDTRVILDAVIKDGPLLADFIKWMNNEKNQDVREILDKAGQPSEKEPPTGTESESGDRQESFTFLECVKRFSQDPRQLRKGDRIDMFPDRTLIFDRFNWTDRLYYFDVVRLD